MKKILLIAAIATGMMFGKVQAQESHSYRGFTEIGFVFGVGDKSKNFDRFSINTTHGYQLTDMVFLGAGLGLDYVTDSNGAALVPLYGDVRVDIPIGSVSIKPFVEAKVGYSCGDLDGFYMQPTAGIRIPVYSHIRGINVGLAYKMQQRPNGMGGNNTTHAVGLNMGIEF